MKRIMLCVALLLPTLLLAAPVPKTPDFSKPSPSKIKVTELFSVYCRGCFYWEENYIPELKQKLQERNITFTQAHMPFMGRFPTEASTALAITEGTPLYTPVKNALFNHIHKDKKGDWASETDFFITLKEAGLSKTFYDQNKRGPVVLKTLADWGVYARSVTAVPGFLLNDKYPIETKGIKSVDDFLKQMDAVLKAHPE